MPDDRLDMLADLVEVGDSLLRGARSAVQMSAEPRPDATESVSVALDAQGQVSS